jgi:hypothetical protein
MVLPHPHQLYEDALARQRELWAEAERDALARQARLASSRAKPPRKVRPRLALVRAARAALAQLL